LTARAAAAPVQPPRASLLPRIGAAVYEGLLVMALVFITGFLMLPLVSPGHAAGAVALTMPPVPARVALFCVLFAVMALYFVWSWTGGRRTLPLKTWRMRIAMPDGGAPTGKTALLRFLAAWIGPTVALLGYAAFRDHGLRALALGLLGFNFLWALVDPQRQFLHDRIAGTCILRDG
jgi:uncharacterized RDD family membrane protein YckC